MENIIEPSYSFDFSKLSLTHPTSIQGGAYFTRVEYNKKPLFLQTPKGSTRQGFVKNGKKYYCDLLFDNNSEEFINWCENLEEKCKKLIYEKKDSWFNGVEENDIDSAFNSIIRIYKSGKYYLVRVNIKNNESNALSIKIYDETRAILNMEDVTHETNIISIIEIQGIKFTSRNFQIEIELKQVMVLNDNAIFNNCLIKTANFEKHLENVNVNNFSRTNIVNENKQEQTINKQELHRGHVDSITNINSSNIVQPFGNLDENNSINENNKENNQYEDDLQNKTNKDIDIKEDTIELDIEDLETNDDSELLKEVDLNVNFENNLETLTLKNPNKVYIDMYKEARIQAKNAKKQAIIAYLKAKNIKKQYMIDRLSDEESDFDAEIDEVSESELEGL